MTRYPVKLTRDGPNVLATFRGFPGATFGANEGEALIRSQDALVTVLMAMVDNRLPIPAPPALKKSEKSISLPPLVEAKVELYREMGAKKIQKAALARLLRWHLPQVDRLLDLRHKSNIEQVEKALNGLGKKLVISVEDEPQNGQRSAGHVRAPKVNLARRAVKHPLSARRRKTKV